MANEVKPKEKLSVRFFSDKTALVTTVIAIVVLIVALTVFLIFRSWSFSNVLDDKIIAHFGDFVGGVVGTLLAFAAAILYYVALKEQRKDVENSQKSLFLQNEALKQQIEEFKQQKAELEKTREVYERQTELMSEQSNIMKRQQFESSFYALLRVYTDCKIQLNARENNCFKTWVERISEKLSGGFKNNDIIGRHNMILSSYEDLYVEERDVLSPYFKTVYRILCLIDNTSFLEDSEKVQYVKIFRTQLSDYETLLLYYDMHSDFSGNTRNISYRWNFLKHYDYLLSLDAKNVYDKALIQDKELVRFLHQFENFVKESINFYCDGFSEEDQSRQKEFEYKGLISEITSNPDITIKLSIPKNAAKLDADFCSLFSDYVCDRVFLSQFNPKKEKLELKEIGEIDGRRVYGCTLHSSFIQKIKTDNDYE